MRSMRTLLSAAMFVPGFAMAQEAAPAGANSVQPAAPAAVVPASSSAAKVTPFGNVKASMFLLDSTRGDLPDFKITDLNLGVNLSKGIGEATAKLNYDAYAKEFTVVEANARLLFPFGVTLGLGRFDTGFDVEIDALKVGYKFNMAAKQNFGLDLFYGNTFEGSENYDRAPTTQWRALAVVAFMNWDEAFANIKYGTEANRMVDEGSGQNPAKVAPWSRLKLEAGYDMGQLGGKGYYQLTSADKEKAIMLDKKINVYKTTGSAEGDKVSQTLIGLEGWGDSRVWDMSGIFAAEDKITYGLVYENLSTKVGDEKATDNKFVVKGGYSTGALATWLELETHSADKEGYAQAEIKNPPKLVKTSNLLSLNMEYSF